MKLMRSRTGKFVARAAMALTGAIYSQGFALAQNNCQTVKATTVDVFSGGNTSSGTVTQGGLLNGTRFTVYRSGGTSTQDPNVVTFLGDMTITTNQGELKTSNVFLFNFATQQSTAFLRINSGASTGRFAAATGLLFLNVAKGTVNGSVFTYFGEITGEICFANQ
ncbi:MAG TPA: hypothetical protein VKV15_27035 [Bryobacteraceae bacterium]|nr:hypothetical protein [Bryobacteraceae bacterium]